MNQESYQALTKMLNAFPKQSADLRALLLTYDEDTTGIPDAAIVEAAQRFRTGLVDGQKLDYAPSTALFYTEARRIASLLPHRGRQALPAPPKPERHKTQSETARLRLKVPMWQYAYERGLMDKLDRANRQSFAAMVALATEWGIAIPDELFAIPEDEAERQWSVARNRAWAEIERNPPPYLRRQARQS